MQTYDLLMLAILVGLTLYGYFKGMAWQVAYVASFVLSYFVAVRFADQLAPKLTFVGPPINKFAAMLIIYAVASLVVWTVFRMIRKMIDSVKMDGFDHQMGALLGFARGVLWCVGVTFFAVTLLPDTQKQQIVHSHSGYYIARLLKETDSIFPPEVDQVLGPYLDRLGEELDGAQPGGGQPSGWPAASQPGSSQPAAPAWGQQPAGQPAAAPSWPAPSRQQPAQPSWPQTGATPPASPDGGFGWPAPSGGGASQPATPAQPTSWPKWD